MKSKPAGRKQKGKDEEKGKRMTLFRDIRKNPVSYLLALPAMVYTFVFGYLTIPYMIIAFQKFSYKTGIFDSEWVGLRNFEFFFKSRDASTVIWNTFKLNLLFIFFITVLSVLVAILLNEVRGRRLKKALQSTYLFPYFISWILVSYILYGVLGTDYGFLNNILESLGFARINFYTSPQYWPTILVILKVWKDVGMKVVIFLATITGFDEGIYEAATIDGASRLQITRKITLPMLMPTVSMLTIIDMGRLFYGDFGMFYSVIGDNGVLYSTTDVIDTFIFRTLRTTGNPSQAMAIGLFQAVMGFIMVYGANTIARKKFSEGALY